MRRGQERTRRRIRCVCCGKEGEHKGRGLRAYCWDKYQGKGRLEEFPPLRKPDPTVLVGNYPSVMERVETFQQMTDRGYRRETIADVLGVSERTLTRYATHLRNTEGC